MASLISKLTPINLLEEKERFFADQSYNPQFIYDETIEEDEIYRYGKPIEKYKNIALEIVNKAYKNSNEADLLFNQGRKYSQEEVTQLCEDFIAMHKLQDEVKVVWSSSFVSRASINKESLKLRTDSDFRKENVVGMLYHEIGTHALRRVNYEQQPFYKKKKKFGFTEYLKTEEGLASLHSLLPQTNKSAHNTAIRYLAASHAQAHSFSELWNFLSQYIQDLETRWMITVRQKKGLRDTSKPGGFTKDIVYFEGLFHVYSWLLKNNFDIPGLYYGKIDVTDVAKARELNPNFEPTLPTFYTLKKDIYIEEILKIGKENNLDVL